MKLSGVIGWSLKSNQYVIIHVVIGVVSGYFLLHPISMVIYWFEFNETPVLLSKFIEIFLSRLRYAFNLKMFPMAISFVVMGGLLIIGVDKEVEITGLHNDYWTLKRRNKEGLQQRLISLISGRLGRDM